MDLIAAEFLFQDMKKIFNKGQVNRRRAILPLAIEDFYKGDWWLTSWPVRGEEGGLPLVRLPRSPQNVQNLHFSRFGGCVVMTSGRPSGPTR